MRLRNWNAAVNRERWQFTPCPVGRLIFLGAKNATPHTSTAMEILPMSSWRTVRLRYFALTRSHMRVRPIQKRAD